MLLDIEAAKAAGAHGVVVGVLRPDGSIDTEFAAEAVRRARPMAVTFHRAFDLAADSRAALAELEGLGVDYVLTSGQARSAWEGRAELKALTELAAARGMAIKVIAAAGVKEANAAKLVATTGVRELHAGSALQKQYLGIAAAAAEERERQRAAEGGPGGETGGGSGNVSMGKASQGSEHLVTRTAPEKVANMRAVLEGL